MERAERQFNGMLFLPNNILSITAESKYPNRQSATHSEEVPVPAPPGNWNVHVENESHDSAPHGESTEHSTVLIHSLD
jgi:hypothetical protein